MAAQQLTLGLPAAPPTPPRRAPRARGPAALATFLESVAAKVHAEVADAQPVLAHPDEHRRRRAWARLGNTVRNAQLIAVRSRRAIDALHRPDLALLRAQQRLVAAIDVALDARASARRQPGLPRVPTRG